MSGLFVANTVTPTMPLSPVIGEEMSADFLITPAKGYSINIDPASDVVDTHSAAGMLLKIKPSALTAATTNVLTWDTATAKLISIVNGVAANVVIQGGNIAIAAGDALSGLGTTTSPLNLVIDPASTAIVTKSAAGLKINVPPTPAAPLSTVTTFAFDALAKKLKVAVDGTAALEVDLGALDDEATKLVLNGQNLELQNSAGAVLSSTPIGQIDAQQLTGAAAAAGYKLTLSNGGSATITCADIGQMYATGVSTAATELLSKDCKAVKVSELPIAPSQLTAGALPTNVTVSGSSINSPITNTAATLPAANITGVLPASALPPTTVSNTIAGTGAARTLSTTVNGVVGTPVPLPETLITCAAISAAYPAAPSATAQANLYTDACTKVKMKRAVSSLGTPLNYWVIDL
jgi:hypothetical protein